MQATAQNARMPQMVHTRPRGQATSSGKHPVPTDNDLRGTDPLADTQMRRAISRSAPTPIGIVVTGDNHLSAALPGYPAERAEERRARLRAGFSGAVDYALQHGARLFVIAGDLFDTPAPSNSDRAFVAGELARLRRANVACVGVSGMSDSPRTFAGHTAAGHTAAGQTAAESPYATYAALDSLGYFPATATLSPRLLTLGNLHLAVVGISTDPAAPAGSDPLAGISVSDPEGVLSRADIGLLIVHAGVEGFARPADESRILTRASLDALPPMLRIVVAGHVHRFGRARIGEGDVIRDIIVPGSTERMDFDSQPGSSGFAWLEVGVEGLSRVKRVAVVEQLRVDVEVTTAQLFAPPAGRVRRTPAPTVPIQPMQSDAGAETSGYRIPAQPPIGAGDKRNGTHREPNRETNAPASGSATGDADLRALAERGRTASDLLESVRTALDQVATEETLVRLRLVGPATREQYHQLPLAQIREYGAAHAFAFELDTSDLRSGGSSTPLASSRSSSSSVVQRAPAASGPLTPAAEVERLLSERLAQASGADPTLTADLHGAAQILLARLQGLQGLQGAQAPGGSQGGSQDREVQR